MKNCLIFSFLFVFIILALADPRPNLIPYPNTITFGDSEVALDPCKVAYQFRSNDLLPVLTVPSYYFDILEFFLEKSFRACDCNYHIVKRNTYRHFADGKSYILNITIENLEEGGPAYPSSTTDESYTLNVDWVQWTLKAKNYHGFLRGIETFLQLFEPLPNFPFFRLNFLPVNIQDTPSLSYRGVMMDTARHFLKVSTLKHVIDGMLFHKLNVFHWHIVDEESFPLQLDGIPIITQYGAYSAEEVYSKAQVKEIIEYARFRGIRVIPEIDAPAHTSSWGFSPEYADITMKCFNWANYNGQLDPTLDKTYEVVKSILDDVNKFFPDEYVHLGGDEVNFNCWLNKPSIAAFMKENNLTTGVELQQYFKDREKTLFNNKKSSIFWVNDANFKYDKNDIMQFWSSTNQYSLISNYTNKVIFSPYDYFYLDLGYGNVFGDPSWAPFKTWKNIYSFNPYPAEIERSRVLGGEVCLWAELNSDYTTDNHLWSRASAFAERMWNAEINNGIIDIATRLYANEKRLIRRGFQPSPLTSQYCSLNLEVCFP